MTKHEVLALTGQSVYQVWLEVAMRSYQPDVLPREALDRADQFIEALLAETQPKL